MMKFKDLEVGKSFIIPRDKDGERYVKVAEWAHWNTRCIKPWNKIISVHGNTEVEVINNGI